MVIFYLSLSINGIKDVTEILSASSLLHPLCDWSPGRQFNRRKSRIVREFEREQGKAGCGQEFTGGAARGAGDGRIGEADVGGEDVVGGVGVEEEGEEGEAGGKKDREVFASRSENNYYYYQPQLYIQENVAAVILNEAVIELNFVFNARQTFLTLPHQR